VSNSVVVGQVVTAANSLSASLVVSIATNISGVKVGSGFVGANLESDPVIVTQFVVGTFNQTGALNRRFVVGNGVSAITRHDALYVNTNSQVGIYGGLRIRDTVADATMGSATLVGGTVVIANTRVQANSRIFISRKTLGASPGWTEYTVNPGVSFTINSSNGADNGDLDWLIIQPD
jgi:hypothetical protein